jgi:hypothetical protein
VPVEQGADEDGQRDLVGAEDRCEERDPGLAREVGLAERPGCTL